MSSDKYLPPTEHKLKELRSKAIVPFSNLSLRLAYAGIIFSMIFILTKNFDKISYSSIIEPLSMNSFQMLLFYSTLITILLLAIYVTLALIQTNFLVVAPKKFPEGIKTLNMKNSIKKTIFSFSAYCFLGMILFLLGTIFTNQFFSSLKSPEPEASEIYFYYLLRISSYSSYLLFISILLITASIIFYILKRINYFEEHKMSRAELLQEISES